MEEVLEFTKRYTSSTPCEVQIHGDIVQIKERFFLLEYKSSEEWLKEPRILVDMPDLEYALQWKLCLMGGGGSDFFHEAKITGQAWFDAKTSTHIITPTRLQAKHSTDVDWLEIDISPEKIAEGKKRWYVPNKEDYYMPPYE